ncbi:hypothetical protein K440DRAFT_643363 [Wilcoxina mikolae CBS 423.85]|nr:hypothetical protein K440DRAFT_643363 [Wilcoxina mikolae CBS 423.85]
MAVHALTGGASTIIKLINSQKDQSATPTKPMETLAVHNPGDSDDILSNPGYIVLVFIPMMILVFSFIGCALWKSVLGKKYRAKMKNWWDSKKGGGSSRRNSTISWRNWRRDTIIRDVEGDAANTGLPLSNLPEVAPAPSSPVATPARELPTEPARAHVRDDNLEVIIEETEASDTVAPLHAITEPRVNPAFLEQGKYGRQLRSDMNRNFTSINGVVHYAHYAPSLAMQRISTMSLSGVVAQHRPRHPVQCPCPSHVNKNVTFSSILSNDPAVVQA